MALVKNRKTPLVSQSETAQLDVIETVDITSNNNTSILVNNNKNDLFSLITNISGSSWTVTYYSQILTRDSQLSGQQPSLTPVAQQYKKINNLELKVSRSLDYSQDDINKQSNLIGEAVLYPVIIPNDGDMFIAEIGESRFGIFKITRTVKLSIYNKACYQISYILVNVNYNADNTTSIDYNAEYLDLEQKTTSETFFKKDNIIVGKDPIIIESEFKTIFDLEKNYKLLIDYYFDTFFSRKLNTLILPKQSNRYVYDLFLMRFINDNFLSEEHYNLFKMTRYNATLNEELNSVSILDAISKRDINLYRRCFKQYGLYSSRNLSNVVTKDNVKYSDINCVIHPKDSNIFLDNTIKTSTLVFEADGLEEAQNDNIFILPDNLIEIPNNPDLINIPNITTDDYYIFTENFYIENNLKSVVEGLVFSYIKKETIDIKYLYNISLLYPSWNLLVQFYYIPIVLTMIKNALKS